MKLWIFDWFSKLKHFICNWRRLAVNSYSDHKHFVLQFLLHSHLFSHNHIHFDLKIIGFILLVSQLKWKMWRLNEEWWFFQLSLCVSSLVFNMTFFLYFKLNEYDDWIKEQIAYMRIVKWLLGSWRKNEDWHSHVHQTTLSLSSWVPIAFCQREWEMKTGWRGGGTSRERMSMSVQWKEEAALDAPKRAAWNKGS